MKLIKENWSNWPFNKLLIPFRFIRLCFDMLLYKVFHPFGLFKLMNTCWMLLLQLHYKQMLNHDIDFTLILISEPNNTDMFAQSGQWHDQTLDLTFEHTLAIEYVATIGRLLHAHIQNYPEISLPYVASFPLHMPGPMNLFAVCAYHLYITRVFSLFKGKLFML